MKYLVAWHDGDGLEIRLVANLELAKEEVLAQGTVNQFLQVYEADLQCITSIGTGSQGQLLINGDELPTVFHFEDSEIYTNQFGWAFNDQ